MIPHALRAQDLPTGRVGLIVLAAGEGRRFGTEDKLAQDLAGKPVVHHVLTATEDSPFFRRILVAPLPQQWVFPCLQ